MTIVEQSATRSMGGAQGAVYTPGPLATFVVDQLLVGRDIRSNDRWMDPACGDGVFLLEIVGRMAAQVDATELPTAVGRCLFGVDIDRAACEEARTAVRHAVAAVSGPQPAGYFEANVIEADFLELTTDDVGRFDLIAGNPPYVSAEALDPDDKLRYLERFETAWGRLDLYALFRVL